MTISTPVQQFPHEAKLVLDFVKKNHAITQSRFIAVLFLFAVVIALKAAGVLAMLLSATLLIPLYKALKLNPALLTQSHHAAFFRYFNDEKLASIAKALNAFALTLNNQNTHPVFTQFLIQQCAEHAPVLANPNDNRKILKALKFAFSVEEPSLYFMLDPRKLFTPQKPLKSIKTE